MSTNIELGAVPAKNAGRDAIHVAVIPMTARELLRPGQRVGVVGGEAGPSEDVIGIVDPYLRDVVPKGGMFWLCLLPNSVTGMRHHWEHPLFDTTPSESEQWLREYAAKINTYDDPETAFTNLCQGLKQKQLFAHGTDLHGLFDVEDEYELRKHAQAHLGIDIEWSDFEFSCSC